MPGLQVVNTTRDKPDPTQLEQFFSKLGKDYRDKQDKADVNKLLNEYQQNRQDANAWEDLQLGLEKSNISPTKRLETQASLNEMKKVIIERDKALNAKVKQGMLSTEERARQKENLEKAGWPDYAAEIYLDAPPGVKSTMEREHKELVERKLRSPLTETDPQENAESPKELPGQSPPSPAVPVPEAADAKELPEIPKPPGMTNAERIKWENSNQKENNVELKKTQEKKKVYTNNDILINSMSKINDSGMLPSGLERILIDPKTGDLRDLAQVKGVNKETALYSKNLKQFLKGAKDFFGARVTNFDVSAFMAQLPGLLNTEQGKRLILKQMSLVNELESAHNNELDSALKKYGRNANYSEIVGVVDKRVAEKEERLLEKINNVVKASDYMDAFAANPEKFKGSTLMEKDGKFKAVRDADMAQARKSGWEAF